jgi:hypothetical protein
MLTYRVAGITLAVEDPLPELPPAEVADDQAWAVGDAAELGTRGPLETLADLLDPTGGLFCRQSLAADGTYVLHYPGLVDFAIDPATRTVRMVAATELADSTRRHLLIDQLVPQLATLDGGLVLHASAVAQRGRAVAFVGSTGAGKSSLAAAHVERGAQLLADDYLLLQDQGDHHLATPAYPGLRLWGDSAERFGGDLDRLGVVAQYTDKRRLPVDQAAPTTLPLGAIVVLGRRPGPDEPVWRQRRLSGGDAYMVVYQQVFRMERSGRERQRAEMERIAHLVESVPVLLIEHRRDYAALPEVLEHLDRALVDLGLPAA